MIGGFALQFYFATLILNTETGYNIFNAVGQGFTTFLKYSEHGASFVFGDLDQHFFAFKVTILKTSLFFF